MASVTLSQSSGYRLAHEDQDWHGWNVHDAAGGLIGRVTDFIIDTEESRAVALILDTGVQVPLDDVLVENGTLVVWHGAASPDPDAPSLPSFEDGTLQLMERVETAVLLKRPVVIEELVITYHVVERQQRIHTTVRRREVHVERTD